MITIIGISFNKNSRKYYFDTNNLNIKKNMEVIVSTEKGLQYGFVVTNSFSIDENSVVSPLKKIIRIASQQDKKTYQKNIYASQKALLKARDITKELNLAMNILSASYNFDRKQLLFNFTADDRVDFRELAKRLAQIYKTRIELRQIGIRDKAREIGGLGPCGRFLCCNSFLTDLNSVTINMAKNQMLALNPNKVNGVCGRLLCCLAYEDETYTNLKKKLPNIGDDYTYQNKKYKVVELDVLKNKIVLESPEHNRIEVFSSETA